jgi:hypothetical protein
MFTAKQLLKMHAAGGVLEDRLVNPARLLDSVDHNDADALELVKLATAVIDARYKLHNAVTRLNSKYNLV